VVNAWRTYSGVKGVGRGRNLRKTLFPVNWMLMDGIRALMAVAESLQLGAHQGMPT